MDDSPPFVPSVKLLCIEPRSPAHPRGTRKFWDAAVRGKELTMHFGRCGHFGDMQVKSFETEEEAAKALAKLVKQKLAKGYRDTAKPPVEPPSSKSRPNRS
jgi:predicted DNA-binding WGR domain protein